MFRVTPSGVKTLRVLSSSGNLLTRLIADAFHA